MITKTAIVIGASSDIGFEISQKLAKEGYSLALTYNKNNLQFEEKITAKKLKSYKLDLNSKDDISSTFTAISKDFKSIDTLVFCAGVAQKRELVLDLSDKEIDNLFEVNVKSTIRCIREFSKLVANKNPASIVLLGSFVEKNGCSCESAYTATKTALSGLCKSLSTELGNLGIRINVVAPGFIDTKMNNNLTKEEKEEIASMTPLKRLGTTDDIANAVCFLCGDLASFITGQTIYVDGGLILE